MRGIRFYLEYSSPTEKNKATRKQPGNHTGNVFAAFVENGSYPCGDGGCVDGVGSVFYQPNSVVVGTGASWKFLQENCLRISEEQAREIHPALFERLDQED